MISENVSRLFVHIFVLNVRSCVKREIFEIYLALSVAPFF